MRTATDYCKPLLRWYDDEQLARVLAQKIREGEVIDRYADPLKKVQQIRRDYGEA